MAHTKVISNTIGEHLEEGEMKGQKCRCGFASLSEHPRCPRCGKLMTPTEWPDVGKVLSFARLHAVPEGSANPHSLALVGLNKGPKVVCWTIGILHEEDEVRIQERDGRYFCISRIVPRSKSIEGRLKA
jgi:uncharacterized OB-fold protein